jgi:hypothetical protein
MKRITLILALVATLALATTGCKDATRAQFSALGKRHRVTLYAYDGKVIKEWISTGNVSNQHASDGWYFEDEKTHLLVEVTGTLVIEVIP